MKRYSGLLKKLKQSLKRFFTGKSNIKDYVIVACFTLIITCIIAFAKEVNNRFIQSFTDFGYWYGVLNKSTPAPTPIDPGPIGPIDPGPIIIPRNFDVIAIRWQAFWQTLINQEHWDIFWSDSLSFLKTSFQLIALPGLGIFLLLFIASKIFYAKIAGTSTDDFSKFARIDYKLEEKVYTPTKKWVNNILKYIFANKFYVFLIWAILLYVSNSIAILISATAYYMYLIAAMSLNEFYLQIFRLFRDLAPLFPGWSIPLWVIFAYILFTMFRLWLGKKKVKELFEEDIKFVEDNLGVAVGIVGPQGSGKDFVMVMIQMINSILFRRRSKEQLINIRKEFRHFPFRKLEMVEEGLIKTGKIVNTVQAKEWIKRVCKGESVNFNPDKKDNIDYIFKKWPDTFFNGLVPLKIREELEDYARLYYVYISKQIVGTYPINLYDYNKSTDQFPDFDDQLFENNWENKVKRLHRSLTIDYNQFRLLNKLPVINSNPDLAQISKIIPDNGSYYASEYDKERLNAITNRSRKDNEVRPDNDGTRQMNNMLRHLSTIKNDYYLRFSYNLQKMSALASAEAYIAETIMFLKGEKTKWKWAIPLFTVETMILEWIIEIMDSKVLKYIQARNDDTFRFHIILRLAALFSKIYVRLFNNYAYRTLNPELHDVAFDGNYTSAGSQKFHLIPKIVYGNYHTDMLSPIFEKAKLLQKKGINQMKEYAGEYATSEELLAQHGYGATEMAQAVVNTYIIPSQKEKEAESKATKAEDQAKELLDDKDK